MTGYPWHTGDELFAADLNAAIAATIVAGPDPPPLPRVGALWWNSNDGNTYIWYADPTSSQWVPAMFSGGVPLYPGGGPYLTIAGSPVVNVLDHGAKGDGATDDTAAIQAALTAYAGKAIVLIPDTGQPYMCGQLLPPGGTDLLIHGTLKLLPATHGSVIFIQNANNVTIRGHGILDGNKAAQTSAPSGTFSSATANHLRVEGITLQNSFSWNLNITASTDVVVDRVTMLAGFTANEFGNGCTNCWLTNCLINGPTNDYGFCFYGGVTNSGAIGNTVTGAGIAGGQPSPGIGVLSDSPQPAPCSNIVIANNIIHGNGGSGISVTNESGSGLSSGVVISGNRCYGNAAVASTNINGFSDICLDYVTGVNIVGNQIGYNTNATGVQFAGIYISSTCSCVSVIGNHVYDVGRSGVLSTGLNNGGAKNLYVQGNYFYDDQTTPSMTHSIVGTAGTQNAYVGNYCTQPVSITGAVDTLLANAVSGAASSSWVIGNNSGYPGTLAINGPTGSNRYAAYQTGGNNRWFAGASSSTENGGGSNTGSDYAIVRISDTNTVLGTPLVIARATGVITLSVAPTFAALPASAVNDAAAATAGVPVGGVYRNGSVLMIRVA